jgi:hypothetical protein
VEVRAARVEEIPLLREIERRAGAMFAGIGLDVVVEEEPPPRCSPPTWRRAPTGSPRRTASRSDTRSRPSSTAKGTSIR